MSKKALGKGIDALFQGTEEETKSVTELPIKSIVPGEHQPRSSFSEENLEELAQSIKQKGVLQPVLVEEISSGSYTIIAGERRYRAAKIAGLDKIPVLVRNFTELEKLEIALIENLQREDLTAIEEAKAYKLMMKQGKYSQEEVAWRVGKNRSTVANSLRLLKLPEKIIQAVHRGEITPGHARAILSINNADAQEKLYNEIVKSELSVRDAETLAGRKEEQIKEKKLKLDTSNHTKKSHELQALEQKFIELFGTKVVINGTDKKGKIEIRYYSADDLDRIWNIVKQ